MNEQFKERFEHNERRKHIHRAEEKYGKAAVEKGDIESSEASDESSGIDEDLIGQEMREMDFISTIAKIRAGDKSIFKEEAPVEEKKEEKNKKEKKEKKFTYKD